LYKLRILPACNLKTVNKRHLADGGDVTYKNGDKRDEKNSDKNGGGDTADTGARSGKDADKPVGGATEKVSGETPKTASSDKSPSAGGAVSACRVTGKREIGSQ
ncbi:MAG: hypothetical protein WD180_03720, partial [Pseudohongiellaceae bacterium]